jgi:hypothetical protein
LIIFFIRRCDVSPLHAQFFRARLVIMGLCFITHDISLQQALSFFCISPRDTQISLCFPLLTVVIPTRASQKLSSM